MKNKGWRTFQIDQVIFFCVSVCSCLQTLEVKLISFAVWEIFYLGVLAIEWLIYLIVQHTKKKK